MNYLTNKQISHFTAYISSNWLKLLLVTNLLALSGGFIVIQVAGFGITEDSALFLLGGWSVAGGGIPYVDFWDINPPLPFFVTAIISVPVQWLPIQNEMQTLFYLSNVVGASVIISTSLLTGQIAYCIFNDGLASFIAGLSIYLLPRVYILPATGIRPRYFLLLFGMASLYSYLREQPWLTGLFAALACTAHQAGLLYLLLAIGITGYRDGAAAVWKVIGMVGAVVTVLLATFWYWGAASSMILQTVFVPFISDTYSLSWAYRLILTLETLGYSLVLLPVAILGWKKLAAPTDFTTIWIPAGAGLFAGYNIFLDTGGPDVWMFIIFFALGIATIAARGSSELGFLILVGVGIVGFAMLFGAYPNPSPPFYEIFDIFYSFVPTPEVSQATAPNDLPLMIDRYWNQTTGDTCHWRLSDTEIAWIEQTNGNYYESNCREPISIIWDRG